MICLHPKTPLAGLNQIFPEGIPIASTLVSVNGIDCYELPLYQIPEVRLPHAVVATMPPVDIEDADPPSVRGNPN